MQRRNDPSAQADGRGGGDENRRVRGLQQALLRERQSAAQLAAALHNRQELVRELRSSTSWRITAPLRWVRYAIRALKTGEPIPRDGDPPPASATALAAPPTHPLYSAPVTRPAAPLLGRRVVIIGELSIPQCAKYRVWQKQQLFWALGVECTVLSWTDHAAVRSALQTASLAIFYRVPGFPETMEDIAEAKRLGVATVWEVDDLIFDMAAYKTNTNLDRLSAEVRKGVLEGVPLYRAAMLACDACIASTRVLAKAMRDAGVTRTWVVENGLDDETLDVAERILETRPVEAARPGVTILYGSGTKTHDVDFEEAAAALEQLLRERADVRLRIVGELNLPAAFDAFGERVERLKGLDYPSYLRLLSEADISIAPLEPVVFNDAKSNIKFLEAAIVEVPSVCSPRDAFTQVITDGVDGFLAATTEEWLSALQSLIDDPARRRQMGRAAAATARRIYTPEALAETQAAPILEAVLPDVPRTKTRVMVVNIYFAPQSFGGATIVAEAMAERLHAREDSEVVVVTSWPDTRARGYDLKRYEANGIPVIAVRLPDGRSAEEDYFNATMSEVFGDLLEATRPDVVHFHSIQGLSASLAEACLERGVPYVITLHDSWWICERQFMVKPDDLYCHQQRIDWAVCAKCVGNLGFSIRRYERLNRLLQGAATLLTPSAFHRSLHLANGLDPAKVIVNKNGVAAAPDASRKRREPGKVRFGFVGGTHPIKGLAVIQRALGELTESNYELVLVDATLAVGIRSIEPKEWPIAGELTVIPPYDRDSMDDFFGRIDVLLFPSQWKESFGLTVREALLRDVWVIATDAGGAAEDIIEGINGTVVPLTDDPGPLRDAIAALLRNPERLAGYVNPHKSRIRDFDAQAEELAGLLQSAARTSVGDAVA